MELIEGHVEAGTQINQIQWGERFRVSRSALREGLKVLATEGLLTHDPHRGYFVANFATSELAQLYWARMVIERKVIESIRMPTEDELQRLADAHKRSIDAMAVGDVSACIGADREFFFGVFDLSPLSFLCNEARRLWDLASGFRSRATTIFTQQGIEPRFREIRAREFRALTDNDRHLLADLVVSERRNMIRAYAEDRPDNPLLFP